MYYSIFYYFLQLAFSLGLYGPPKLTPVLDNDATYILPIKTRFLRHFDNIQPVHSIDMNENIDPIFYDKKGFANYMMESETPLEKIWRTRIMFESTPRGNIAMFYDAFKLGFSFYCDQKTVSYDILNAAAMKYVTLFRCRHFFIDELIIPKEHTSPFIKTHFTDEPPKKNATDKSAFVKLRNYSMNNTKISPVKEAENSMFSNIFQINPTNKISVGQPHQTEQISNEKLVETMKNKFIYLGKIHNFKMSQPAPKKYKVLAKFTSPLLENIALESSHIQRECMSYNDFKLSLAAAKSCD